MTPRWKDGKGSKWYWQSEERVWKNRMLFPQQRYLDLYKKDYSTAQTQEGEQLSRQQLQSRIWSLYHFRRWVWISIMLLQNHHLYKIQQKLHRNILIGLKSRRHKTIYSSYSGWGRLQAGALGDVLGPVFQNSGRKEAIEVQSSPVKDLRNKTMEESLKELRFSPVEGRLWSDKVLNMP